MKRMVVFVMLIVVFAAHQAAAQVFTTPKGGAENVTFEQVGGGTVHITYDLVSSDPRAVFAVTLDASQDRGNTFTVRPSSVSGDVGPGVKPGTGKRIVWESGRDVERLEIDQFRFRISAQAGPLEMQKSDLPPAPVAAAPTPAAAPKTQMVTPAAPANPPQTAAAKPKSGGGAKWLLIGGGAAAAAGVAAASGGGSGVGSTPTTNTPLPPTANTPLTPTMYSGPFSGQGVGTGIYPAGRCDSRYAFSGTLRFSLEQQSDGTAKGTWDATWIDNRITVSGPPFCSVGGNTGGSHQWNGLLTGTASNLAFNEQRPFSLGPNETGGGTLKLTFSGALTNSVLTGTLTYARATLLTINSITSDVSESWTAQVTLR